MEGLAPSITPPCGGARLPVALATAEDAAAVSDAVSIVVDIAAALTKGRRRRMEMGRKIDMGMPCKSKQKIAKKRMR